MLKFIMSSMCLTVSMLSVMTSRQDSPLRLRRAKSNTSTTATSC